MAACMHASLCYVRCSCPVAVMRQDLSEAFLYL